MTEKEISELIANYLVNHWQEIILGSLSLLGALMTGVWFVARHWYQRDITHLKEQKTSLQELSQKECNYLTKQIQDKESYARGVIEVMNQRLTLAEEKPKKLLDIIKQQESEILRYKRLFEEQKALMENSNIPNFKLEANYSLKTIKRAYQTFYHLSFNDAPAHCIRYDQMQIKNKDTEILFLNGLVTLQIQKLLEIERDLKYLFISYKHSDTDLIKHFVKVLSALVDKSSIEIKLDQLYLKETINLKENRENKTNDEKPSIDDEIDEILKKEKENWREDT